MATMVSHWTAISRRTIAAKLVELPPDAPMSAKRAALKDAYPFGEMAMHPYKVWLKEVRRAIGTLWMSKNPLRVNRRCDPPGIRPFLLTIRDHADDDGPRLVLADWLEERGDARAELLREPPPGTIRRACQWYHRLTQTAPNDVVQRSIADLMRGEKLLLFDLDMLRAIQCEINERILAMFRSDNKK